MAEGHSPGVEDLPQEVVAQVPSNVPFSQDKAALQLVCKRWRQALCTRTAHSVGFFHTSNSAKMIVDDRYIDFGSLRPRLSSHFLQSCRCLYVACMEPGSGSLDWLPEQIEKLKISPTWLD